MKIRKKYVVGIKVKGEYVLLKGGGGRENVIIIL